MKHELIRLAKKCGIRGYTTLTEDELIIAIEVEGQDRPQLLEQLKSLKKEHERQKEENERLSFMKELESL